MEQLEKGINQVTQPDSGLDCPKKKKAWGKPFLKGDPRINRKGSAARKTSFAAALREAGTAETKYDRWQKVSKIIWAKAEAGEPWAVEFLADRMDGKATQKINFDGDIQVIGPSSPEDRQTIENI